MDLVTPSVLFQTLQMQYMIPALSLQVRQAQGTAVELVRQTPKFAGTLRVSKELSISQMLPVRQKVISPDFPGFALGSTSHITAKCREEAWGKLTPVSPYHLLHCITLRSWIRKQGFIIGVYSHVNKWDNACGVSSVQYKAGGLQLPFHMQCTAMKQIMATTRT